MTTADNDGARNVQQAFDSHASAWVQYVESEGGHLRSAVILHHLRRHLAATGKHSLRILDAGGGTGAMAVELAGLGHQVTLLDFSAPMLAVARSRCERAGAHVDFVCADAWQAESLWLPESFDAILCHSLLEFAHDPSALLAQLVALLRPDGILSVVVGNRHALVFREAIVRGNAALARQGLDAEIPGDDLFGLPRRTFEPDDIRALMETHGIATAGEYGIRIFCDLIKTATSGDDLRDLEFAASSRMPYRRLGRFIQILGTKTR